MMADVLELTLFFSLPLRSLYKTFWNIDSRYE